MTKKKQKMSRKRMIGFILLVAAGIAYIANMNITASSLLMPTDPYDPWSPRPEVTANNFAVRSWIIFAMLVLGIILVIFG